MLGGSGRPAGGGCCGVCQMWQIPFAPALHGGTGQLGASLGVGVTSKREHQTGRREDAVHPASPKYCFGTGGLQGRAEWVVLWEGCICLAFTGGSLPQSLQCVASWPRCRAKHAAFPAGQRRAAAPALLPVEDIRAQGKNRNRFPLGLPKFLSQENALKLPPTLCLAD